MPDHADCPLTLPEPPLGDEGFFLRPPALGDVDTIYRLCQDPLVARFTTIPQPYKRTHAIEYVEKSSADWESGSGAAFVIISDSTGEVIGTIGVVRKPWDHAVAEIGYWLSADARGKGIASRAVRLLSRWAIENMNLARLQLGTNRANFASQRVAEKAGFKHEGILRNWREIRGERVDEVHFSLIPSDLDEPGVLDNFCEEAT